MNVPTKNLLHVIIHYYDLLRRPCFRAIFLILKAPYKLNFCLALTAQLEIAVLRNPGLYTFLATHIPNQTDNVRKNVTLRRVRVNH
jgi:hypothetical protein